MVDRNLEGKRTQRVHFSSVFFSPPESEDDNPWEVSNQKTIILGKFQKHEASHILCYPCPEGRFEKGMKLLHGLKPWGQLPNISMMWQSHFFLPDLGGTALIIKYVKVRKKEHCNGGGQSIPVV